MRDFDASGFCSNSICKDDSEFNRSEISCILYAGIDGRIILRLIFKKWDVGVRTGLGWLRIGIRGRRL
jgi:hypothetical protein